MWPAISLSHKFGTVSSIYYVIGFGQVTSDFSHLLLYGCISCKYCIVVYHVNTAIIQILYIHGPSQF